jgi:hypothetical protein
MKTKIENKQLYEMGETVAVIAVTSKKNVEGKIKLERKPLAVTRSGKITGVKKVCGNELWCVRWGVCNKEVLVRDTDLYIPAYGSVSEAFPVFSKQKTFFI